ncbi:ABC transporter ATP-binding protein [Roseiarcaceae bacterium H3SJ34-1]|uniref:ABC transporter ATP-binding protein n=1 Tax=Terripilifer ovatus TaxID=3032367 RepID=UPI003AB94491|nr:ABC transporter ATP-binding protein [Roseiarcaceae bacterium H3SJ34-1]
MSASDPLLRVAQFALAFRTETGLATVLDGVDLEVARGEILGLVGESGCGKSTLVRAILGLMPAGARVLGGRIEFGGQNLLDLDEAVLSRDIRAGRIGFIPQDPFQSFNPLFRVGSQMLEIMRWHAPPEIGRSRSAHRARLLELMERVRIPAPDTALKRFPHEFSGGQLQRLMIAAAIACKPDLVLADEPTSALDVTTQQQILALLEELAREMNTAVILVTHDLGLVAQYCDRVSVMYAGQTVESFSHKRMLEGVRHPYTRLLLDCHPDRAGALRGIPGIVPGIARMPPGCRFGPRCPAVLPICSTQRPKAEMLEADHSVQCWAVSGSIAARVPADA